MHMADCLGGAVVDCDGHLVGVHTDLLWHLEGSEEGSSSESTTASVSKGSATDIERDIDQLQEEPAEGEPEIEKAVALPHKNTGHK
jgi:hypothetical protein